MKLLHLGKYYPPYRGGMETVLQNLAEGLLAAGCDVTLVTAGGRGADAVEPVVTRDGIGRGRLVRLAAAAVVNSQPVTPSLVSVLRRELARARPDVLHLHLPNPLAAAAWCVLQAEGSLADVPTAVWYHADITRQRLGRLLVKPILSACLRGAAGISVSSRALRDSSATLAPHVGKVAVIPFGIEPAPWMEVVARRDGPFLFVGRLVPYKGLLGLLRAVAAVPEVKLVLAGDGPQRAELEREVEDLGLAVRVRFAGSLDQLSIARELSRARALVLPSVDASEAFGLVQLEAMAAAVPVITTDLPTGVREVGVAEETGLLVPPRDVAALATALRRVQDDPGLGARLGTAGRARYLELYTRERMIASLVVWYDRLAGSMRQAGSCP